MRPALTADDLLALIQSVFTPGKTDRNLAILIDIPDDDSQDNPDWRNRRALVWDWFKKIKSIQKLLGLGQIALFAYPNVHSNNADLPASGCVLNKSPEHLRSSDLPQSGSPRETRELLGANQLVLAPTEFSTTAPLKLLSKQLGFRAATMPGFSAEMIPALRLDYGEINRRVLLVKEKLDAAEGLAIQFTVAGKKQCPLHFDLRFRTAHASGGRFPRVGIAGNLPSGEAYIVPYEGEKEEISNSEGILPVQFEEEIVYYRIKKNKAIDVLSDGLWSRKERDRIHDEPAYANIAELGFGVLGDFGLKPIGEILLDEKLGLHIAFGRSDHFGGAVGVKDFSSPDKVVHIDRIYIPETQPDVHVDHVIALYPDEKTELLMQDGKYLIFD